MGLEWVLLTTAVGVEAVLLLAVTVPFPQKMTRNVILLFRRILQPLMAILPFALFELLDVYWKYENRISCGEHCTSIERDRFEYKTYKAQRNGLLALSAILLYWLLFRYVHYLNDVYHLEAKLKNSKKE